MIPLYLVSEEVAAARGKSHVSSSPCVASPETVEVERTLLLRTCGGTSETGLTRNQGTSGQGKCKLPIEGEK